MSQQHLISGDLIALHDYRSVYFAIPKVANSSIKAVCADLIRTRLNPQFVEKFWSDRWKPRIFREKRARAYLKRKRVLITREELAECDTYWKFCLVRNPWDRIVSCWKQKVSDMNAMRGADSDCVASSLAGQGVFYPGMSFQRFVHTVAEIPDEDANGHFRSQYTFVTDEDGKLVVDFVGRMEAIETDIDYVFRTIGVSGHAVPHLLASGGKPYVEYYDRETREVVAKRFARDISLFEYSFYEPA